MFKKIMSLGCAEKELKSEEDQKSSMADSANKKAPEKTEGSSDAPPIPPVRKNKLARRSKSLLDEITEVLKSRSKSLTMESDTTESDFSDFDHSLFTRRNLSSPPLRPNPDSSIPKTDLDSINTDSPSVSVNYSSAQNLQQSAANSFRHSPAHSSKPSPSHSLSWSPAHSQYGGKSPRSPARKQRQYIVNPDDNESITRVTTTYYQTSRPNSVDSYVTQNAYLTTDSSSYDSTTTDTESEIASPVRNSVYGLRYRKIHNDDTDNKSDEDILSDAESLEQLMLHRLPGENLGMILGVEAGKKGSSKVRKVVVKSVTLGGAAYRATGGTQGIRVGDEIVEVNRKILSTLTHDECVSVFHEMPLRILLSVRRNIDPGRRSGQSSKLHQKLGPVHSWPSYNGYQSETSESEADGGYPRGFQTHEIKIHKNSKESLGISIVPSYGSTREYYQIKRLLPSGVCARDQKLQVGDRLVSCNGQSLKGVTQNECLNILKSAGNDLKLTVLSSDNLAHLGMDSNTESDAESVNNNIYKNGFEDIQHSEHGLSASKTNANVLFAQKNVKLAYTPPYIPNKIPSDSESSEASTPSRGTQSVISEVDQHILDLTGLGTSQLNNMESASGHNFRSVDNSLLESIPPPVEFSDNPISPEESETSTLTDPSDTSLPVTNLDDLLGNDSTATNTPIHTTSTPIHNAFSTISNSFPEHDELLTVTSSSNDLTVVSTSENVVKYDESDKLSEKLPNTDIDNVQTSSDQNSNNLLEFDTKVSNVIEGGQSTTLFDIGVKSVSDARHVSQTSNIDDLLFLDQTNIQQSSSNSNVEINNEAVSQGQNVSPQVNVLNHEQTHEKTSKSLDNVTTVQVGLISLDPNGVVDEGLVTKVPIIDLDDTKHSPQIENQVTQVVVNERPKITKVDVGYDKSLLHRHENEHKIPGATVFSVDDDVKESNTAKITIDNPNPPVPTPRLSPHVVPRKHLPKSETIDTSDKKIVPSSPKPLPRKTHVNNVGQSHFPELHQEPSLTLNTAKLVEAAKPSATIVVSNSDQDIMKSCNKINETDVNKSVETITESKPTLIHDSEKDQNESSSSNIDTSKNPLKSTVTVKTPRLKSSKEERSDRSGKIMVTSYQNSDIRLSRPVEEEESIQPMTYIQDELGNRSCVPTPPVTPKRQPKKKDEEAKMELTDILMNLVNLESKTNNDSQPESTVIEEGLIEPQKVSRQTMETVLGAFSSLIPGLDKPQKKSIFQKAVSEVIDDMDDDNNNVSKQESKKKEGSHYKDETDNLGKTKKVSENSQPVNEIPSVLQTGFASISEALQSKSIVSEAQSELLKEKTHSMPKEPTGLDLTDSSSVSVSQNVVAKPKDIEIESKKKTPKNQKQEIPPKSEKVVPRPSLISATAPKRMSTAPHITSIKTQPFSSLKSGLTSFSTNKVSKADYPKRRCEDQPFQVDVLKGIAGLGIKLAVGNDGLVKVTNIQTSGPVAKNGQVKVGDYVLSINSTVLRGVSDNKVQQILRLLPRGLSKLVISTTIPDAHSPDKTGPLSIDTDCTDNSMELSPTSPSTGFTKYGVRVSPKPFSSLSNSSSPKSLSDGLASIKESKYSPVSPPTRKVSVDKSSDSVNGSSNGSASVEYPFGKDEPTSNGAKSVPFPFNKSEPRINSVNKTNENQNGLADELVIKTDSSIGSSPIMSPRSPAALSPALSPRSDSGDSGIEKAPIKPTRKPVHSSNIYVNKNKIDPAKKLGIDIPKSHAESKIIAATWGKETDEVTSPQPVKNPPPVAPKPKSRTAKAPLPDPPKKQVEKQKSVETPIQPQQSKHEESQPSTTRQKSPGVETLNLNDKLKRFETEIQRQTDLAKPPGPPPVATRRTSSSSEHSTASLRSSSPDVFFSDEKKSNAPTMVYSTTVKSKGELPKDQDRSYSMKITNQENSLEITRTEVRKQSVEEPKRKTSSGSNPSPLSPSSPFYQDLTEKPVKVNPVRLNRALAPKGSSQNQNVEINSTVKLTAPSQPPPEIKPKPKTASWFAGKESDTSTTNTECTSPTPSSVVSTEPHLIFESPKCKSPRNKGTKKSPSDSMNSPTSPKEPLVPSDTKPTITGVTLEYESPKSPKQDIQRKYSQEEIQTKFDDLLNLDVEKTIVETTSEVNKPDIPVEHEEITSENVESAALNVNNSALVNNTEDVKVDDINMTLEDSCETLKEDALTGSKDQHQESEIDDSAQTDDQEIENTENVLVNHIGTDIPDSVVEPYAAALVEKVIDSAKEFMKGEEHNHTSTENVAREPISEDKTVADDTTLVESSVPAPVEEILIPESIESVHTRPDILSDVQTENETNEVSKIEPEPIASESESERSSSPPPLPSSAPPPLPSSPPPMTAIPPPTLLPSFEDPPDLVDFMTGSIIKPPSQFTDPQPDIIHSSPIVQEDEIRSLETKDVAAAPNLIKDIAHSTLPDVTNDNSAINEIESRDVVESESRGSSEVETGILDGSVGSSVDPVEDQLISSQSDSLLNTACNSQHDNVISVPKPQESSETEQTSTSLVDTVPDGTMPNQTNSTDLNVVKASKNNLLDSNENLFSAKPVIISGDEPVVSNSTSSIQVSSFQESLPRTDQDDFNNKIYSSTPAKSLATPLVATDIDIDNSFKSDISNDTLLDNTNNSEYVNISMTSNGPDVTNEALKISSSSMSKRDWTFVTSEKDTSVIEGKANVSFEFLDFTSVSLIEPEELKRLVDQANQTMDRTGISSSNQIIVVLLHRKDPTDKVGLELMKGSQGKVIISGLMSNSLASTDCKIKVTDCLVSVNGKPVDDVSVTELQELIETPCSTVVLVLSRGENSPKTPSSPKPKDREARKSSPITPTTPTSPSFTNLDFTCGETMEVTMMKGATGVGFCLAGGIGSPQGDMPIIIKRIFKGGPADKCGQLQVKDQILQVNDLDFTTMRHYEAWNHLKYLPDGEVKLVIRRGKEE